MTMDDGCGARIRWRLFPANASYDDFSNTGTPQNRDSYETVAVGCAQLLFEPVAIRLNSFHPLLVPFHARAREGGGTSLLPPSSTCAPARPASRGVLGL